MDAGIKNLTVGDRMLITSAIFNSGKENVKSDIASFNSTCKLFIKFSSSILNM